MKRLYTIILTLAAAFCMQSCLFEQEDIFDESSSVRLQNVIEETAAALVDAPEGWLFELYPEGTQSYGGYATTLKFDELTVEVHSEIASDVTKGITSYYKVTNDNGPVLIFDTYNEYIHYFSTPSSSRYQAYQGEFEFVICDIKSDVITLRGCKTGNVMYLRKLTEPAVDYLRKLPATEDNLVMSGFVGTVAGQSVTATMDIDNRQASVTIGDDTYDRAYAITDKGIRLYQPVPVGDSQISCIDIKKDGTMTIGDGPSMGTVLSAVYPQGWRPYDAYPGKYIFTYARGSFNCEIVPNGDGATYKLLGWSEEYDVILTYNKGKGNIHLLCQMFKKGGEYVMYGGKYLGLTPLQASNDTGTSGYLSYDSTVGMMTVWNGDEANPKYQWKDNGRYSRAIDTFWFAQYKGPSQVAADRSSASSLPASYQPFGQNNIMFKPQTLVKVSE